jgi:8-oxo-dGTP pyrophosphatase MutT (NUDIX family)
MRFRAELFVPFFFERARIGWLRPELAARLSAWPKVFRSNADAVHLLDKNRLAPVVEALAADGFIPGWRNERYAVEGGFEIERAAARPFGLTTHAVHLNGIAENRMWLARRAASKAIDPGMLDNLVGGGIAVGFSVAETLLKEAWEEAGIPAELARRATRGGTARVLREVPEGVQSEVIHVYDLELPQSFRPQNQDGEVSEFRLLPFSEIEKLDLTYEASLAAKDYFSRKTA